MSFLSSFSYFFRKNPVLRILLFIFVVVLLCGIALLVTMSNKKEPQLVSVTPQIAAPGENITITGNHFGSKINDGYVEISGNRVTASHYVLWTDNSIVLTLPSNVSDGFLYVVTANGKSTPINFTNNQNIPKFVKADSLSTAPAITDTDKFGTIGKTLTITGKNFGALRNNSKVYFSIQTENGEIDFIPCPDRENYYEFWNNQEIRVRVPNGVTSGDIFVLTNNGASNKYNLPIQNMPGSKTFPEKKIYEIKLSANIEVAGDARNATEISIHIPIPPETTTQRQIEISSAYPKPAMENYMNTIVHQFSVSNRVRNFDAEQTFIIPVYAIKTTIVPYHIIPYSEETKKFLSDYLQPSDLIPSDDESVIALQSQIARNIQGPYQKAQAIYEYLIKNFSIVNESVAYKNKNDILMEDIIAAKNASFYDINILYCSLLRASGIPAIPLAGFYIDSEQVAHKHWWLEFYIENFGWIPVDIILGSGNTYETSDEKIDTAKAKSFYFGSLDANRIAFSRGWNRIISTNINNKTADIPRSFAFQSIWEETSAEVAYKSTWNDIEVLRVDNE